jgi:uncharacterized sporulation protein YeaH/YhbH (DUF444 family)
MTLIEKQLMNEQYKALKAEFEHLGLEASQVELLIRNIEFEATVNGQYMPNYLYALNDLNHLQKWNEPQKRVWLKTLEDLLEQDKKRMADGFPKRIRLGKLVKPAKGKESRVIVVPTTTEPKFYHDNSISEDPNDLGQTGGTGDEQEGDVLGEQQAQPEQGEGEGQGAGEGGGEGHDISQEAFDLGKVITEQFKLPNLKDKGQKRSLVKYTYDLTDINKGFGQLLDKKATMKELIKKNILLDRLHNDQGEIDVTNLIISPKEHVYRIMAKEKEYESQALVFFIRDYSGSMQGEPTEAISTQHLLIYSWLMYQYQNRVENRFILHDTDAKEVPDFYTYIRSNIAGGTKVAPAFKLVEKMIADGQLDKLYNLYIFYGTDGDDWETDGKEALESLKNLIGKVNRIGISIAKNSWTGDKPTTIENYLNSSYMLKTFPDHIRMDAFSSSGVSEDRLVEGIRKLIE